MQQVLCLAPPNNNKNNNDDDDGDKMMIIIIISAKTLFQKENYTNSKILPIKMDELPFENPFSLLNILLILHLFFQSEILIKIYTISGFCCC